MRRRPSRLLTLILVLSAAALGGHAGEPPQELLDALGRGREALENFDYAGAVAAYGEAVRAHREGRFDTADATVRRAVTVAYEGKAAAHLGLEETEQVSATLVEALGVDPSFRPDPMLNSPRLLEIFDDVRRRTIGFLSVQTDPPGCTVWIGDRRAGDTPLEAIPWIAGPAEIRLEKAGFDPERVSTDIAAGSLAVIHEQLSPNARVLIFRTSPPGVRIVVDGEERAVTDGPASEEEAQALGFEAADLSREVRMLLPPGQHAVRFELPCHEPWVESIPVEADPQPLHYKPMVLEQRVGSLTLRSRPPGALVRIDSAGGVVFDGLQEVGRTPMTVEGVCAGERRIELAGDARGKWSGRLTLEADEHREFEEALRPTLAFVGVLAGDGVAAEAVAGAAERVRQTLGTIRAYNTVVVHNPLALEPSPRGLLPPGEEGAAAAIAAKLDADLLLVGALREERLRPVLALHLYSRHQPAPESLVAALEDTETIDGFLGGLERAPAMRRPWIGLLAVDVEGDRPAVARVVPGGPAEAAGVLPGDRLLSMGERRIEDVVSLRFALEDLQRSRAGRDVTLRVRRAGQEIEMPLTLGSTPVIVGPNQPGLLYNKLLVDLDYQAAEANEAETRGVALLNRAMAFAHFDRFDLAVREALDGLELPAGPGISSGTVSYLRGLCYERLGIPDRARAAFEAAAAAAGATLESHDGPAVAPLARFHLDSLR